MKKSPDVNLEDSLADYLEWVELCKMARQIGITPQEIRIYFGWTPLLEDKKEEMVK